MLKDKKLYQNIYRNAWIILLCSCVLTYVFTKAWVYVISTLFGGILSMFGFTLIILFTHHVSLSGNVNGKFVGAYIFRYLIYFIAMFLAMKAGLNIISILIGFLCINLSIKIDTLIKRKEEN